MFFSHYLAIVGELDLSSEHMRIARELDPLNPFVRGLESMQLFMLGDYAGAITAAEEALASPGQAFGYITLFLAHRELGNEDAVIESFADMLRHVAGQPETADRVGTLYAQLGYEGALNAIAAEMQRQSETRYVPPMIIARLYDEAGTIDDALVWYRNAFLRSDPDAPYIGANVKNPSLRSHPDFQALLREMNLGAWIPHEN